MMYAYITLILLLVIQQSISDQSSQCAVYKEGRCLKIFKNEIQTYDDAINTCNGNDGSSLLSISSQEEQNFLFNILKAYGIVNDVWLNQPNNMANNIIISDNSLLLKWLNNSNTKYTNWAYKSPDISNRKECVKMSMNEPHNGKWFDVTCDTKNLVVCYKTEFPSIVLNSSQSRPNSINHIEFEDFKSQIEIKLENTIIELYRIKHKLQKDIVKSTPPGTIAYFADEKAPEGWLKANGDSVSRLIYSNLFATIGNTYGSGDGSGTTFTLPDLRGEFIRGWSDDRDVDEDRNFGSFQWGSSIPLAGYINERIPNSMGTTYHDRWDFAGTTFDDGFEKNVASGQTRNGITYPNDRNGNEVYYGETPSKGYIKTWNIFKGTRPRNIALLACIKY